MPTKPKSEPAVRAPFPLEGVVAELERTGARIRLRTTPEGYRFRVSPAGAVTPALRDALQCHRDTIARLLLVWGDEAGSLVLRTLWHPAPLPASPFQIKPGVTVVDGPAWLAKLRRRALDGPSAKPLEAEAFVRDLAALVLLPTST